MKLSVEEMLGALLFRTGKVEGATVVMDRGISSRENLIAVKALGLHYVVAAKHEERYQWLDELETAEDWTEVIGCLRPPIRARRRVRSRFCSGCGTMKPTSCA